MTLTTYIKGAIGAAALSLAAASGAGAAEPVRFGMCYDLSKAYTFLTPQLVQAAKDLAALTNKKGGLAGRQVEIVVQDHGNEAQRGIECYERLRREGVIVFDFMSTPVGNALVPRVMKDENIQLLALAGRGDAVDGTVFKQIFPMGPTYWGQAANDVAFIKQQNGGSLKGLKIGFVYFDYPFGQEPIRVLQALAKEEGFDLQLFPVPMPGTDQNAVWTQVRRANPDWIISWMFSNGHVVASREMRRNGIPLTKYISSNWLNEVDLRNIGLDAAKGIRRGTNVVGGQNVPVIQEIITELYDKGQGSGDRAAMNDTYYNTGLAIYSTAFEAVRRALADHGPELTAAGVKAGFESLRDFNANGLTAPITITAEDHGGGGKTRIEMWDGTKWVPQSDWIKAYDDQINKVVKEYSSQFTTGK